jgi:hypothetical protein
MRHEIAGAVRMGKRLPVTNGREKRLINEVNEELVS